MHYANGWKHNSGLGIRKPSLEDLGNARPVPSPRAGHHEHSQCLGRVAFPRPLVCIRLFPDYNVTGLPSHFLSPFFTQCGDHPPGPLRPCTVSSERAQDLTFLHSTSQGGTDALAERLCVAVAPCLRLGGRI
jgi:hypothetical protein